MRTTAVAVFNGGTRHLSYTFRDKNLTAHKANTRESGAGKVVPVLKQVPCHEDVCFAELSTTP